ncbi:hypothetical protein ACTFIR_007527 [Dictyostelium discoideum]
MPFGLSTAPSFFTMLLRPVLRMLRDFNVSVIAYLDDLLIFGATKEEYLSYHKKTMELLVKLGFKLNLEKNHNNNNLNNIKWKSNYINGNKLQSVRKEAKEKKKRIAFKNSRDSRFKISSKPKGFKRRRVNALFNDSASASIVSSRSFYSGSLSSSRKALKCFWSEVRSTLLE